MYEKKIKKNFDMYDGHRAFIYCVSFNQSSVQIDTGRSCELCNLCSIYCNND